MNYNPELGNWMMHSAVRVIAALAKPDGAEYSYVAAG